MTDRVVTREIETSWFIDNYTWYLIELGSNTIILQDWTYYSIIHLSTSIYFSDNLLYILEAETETF